MLSEPCRGSFIFRTRPGENTAAAARERAEEGRDANRPAISSAAVGTAGMSVHDILLEGRVISYSGTRLPLPSIVWAQRGHPRKCVFVSDQPWRTNGPVHQ